MSPFNRVIASPSFSTRTVIASLAWRGTNGEGPEMIGMLGAGRVVNSGAEVVVLDSPMAMAHAVAWRLRRSARVGISARGVWRVSLAGGETPRALYRLLAEPHAPVAQLDWSRTEIFFGDARAVPPDHPDSNYRMIEKSLLAHIAVPRNNVHRMEGEARNLAEAAATYETLLDPKHGHDHDYLGRRPAHLLDLAILGMGTDGHTASLFPDSAALGERHRLCVAVTDVRLARPRLTLTYPVFESAREVAPAEN